MPNQRISELKDNPRLFCDCVNDVVSGSYNSPINNSEHNDLLFILAREKISNEKISFKNLKKSSIDNSLLTQGNQEVSGSKIFINSCKLNTQESVSYQNLYTDEYINNESDGSCSARFEQDKLFLSADKEVCFSSFGNKNTFFSNSGCLNINSNTNNGSIDVNGDAYINEVYVKNINENFIKLPFQDKEDETVCFQYKMNSGDTEETIYLPKTFKYKPIITVNLFHSNSQVYLPFILLNVNEYSFQIKFSAPVPASDYIIHVSAFSPSILPDSTENTASDARIIQRFHTQLSSNSLEHIINFPFVYSGTPSVCASVESANNIVPYAISSVNNSSYTIRFESEVNQDYIIHTLSQAIT